MMPVRAPAWSGGPDVPAQFSGVRDLGDPITVHRPESNAMTTTLVVGSIGAVFFLAGVVLAAFLSPVAFPGLLVGSILLPIALYNFVVRRRAARCVVIYGGGFAADTNGVISVWPWRDITGVTTKEKWVSGGRRGYHERRYDIAKATGETVILDRMQFENVEDIVKVIKDRVAQQLLPGLQAAYDSGQWVEFGAVVVSKTEIRIAGQSIPWSGVSKAEVKDGRLIVTPRGGSPVKMTIWNIPNIELLGSLIGISKYDMQLMYS